jgi:hypothetical protein
MNKIHFVAVSARPAHCRWGTPPTLSETIHGLSAAGTHCRLMLHTSVLIMIEIFSHVVLLLFLKYFTAMKQSIL